MLERRSKHYSAPQAGAAGLFAINAPAVSSAARGQHTSGESAQRRRARRRTTLMANQSAGRTPRWVKAEDLQVRRGRQGDRQGTSPKDQGRYRGLEGS